MLNMVTLSMWGHLGTPAARWAIAWGRDGTDRSQLDSWSSGQVINLCLAAERWFLLFFLMCMCQIVCVEPKDTLSCHPEEHHPRVLRNCPSLIWNGMTGQWAPDFLLSPALRCQAHMLYQHIHVRFEERTHVLILTSRVLPDWALPGVPRQDIHNQNAELISKLAQLWKQNTHLLLVISPSLACAEKVPKHTFFQAVFWLYRSGWWRQQSIRLWFCSPPPFFSKDCSSLTALLLEQEIFFF